MTYIERHKSLTASGFSLSEILISLAILAIIYSMCIPLVLNPSSNAKKAVFLEVINTLNDITYTGIASDELTVSNPGSYILRRVNAAKVCPTNSETEGCWTVTPNTPGYDTETQEPGFVLHNGAVVFGLADCCDRDALAPGEAENAIVVDWNGANGPNLVGDDRLLLLQCYGTVPCTYHNPTATPVKVGSIGPHHNVSSGDSTSNLRLYNEVMQ